MRAPRPAVCLAAIWAATAAPAPAHPLCGINATLDTQPRLAADGATLIYSADFCDVTGVSGWQIEYATLPVDPERFVPGSGTWRVCPRGGCTIDADGTLRIPLFSLLAYECVHFELGLTLQPGQRGETVCEQGAVRTRFTGAPLVCDRPTDDPYQPLSEPTCVTVADDAPGCLLSAAIDPTFHSGCADEPVTLTAASSMATGCPGGALAYQWSRDGVDLAGATSPALTIPASDPPSGATYRALVSCAALPACRNRTDPVLVVRLGPGEVLAPDAACAGQALEVSVPGGATCSIDCGNGAPPSSGACAATCTYAALGRYTISAPSTDGNGCTATPTRPIDVIAPPVACIAALAPVCEGNPTGPTHVRLASCSPGGIQYQWTADLGSLDDAASSFPDLVVPDVSAPTPVHLTLAVAAPGCGAPREAAASFDLVPAPRVTFTPVPDATCANLITFQPGDPDTGGAVAYFWEFGDGATSTAKTPTHAYGIGSFDVRLTETTAGAPACATTRGTRVEVVAACCGASLSEVSGLHAARGPSRDDVMLTWDAMPAAEGGFDVWAAGAKGDISAARAPGGAGVTEVCTAGSSPFCVNAGAVLPAAGAMLFYQVRGVCDGQEGP